MYRRDLPNAALLLTKRNTYRSSEVLLGRGERGVYSEICRQVNEVVDMQIYVIVSCLILRFDGSSKSSSEVMKWLLQFPLFLSDGMLTGGVGMSCCHAFCGALVVGSL